METLSLCTPTAGVQCGGQRALHHEGLQNMTKSYGVPRSSDPTPPLRITMGP